MCNALAKQHTKLHSFFHTLLKLGALLSIFRNSSPLERFFCMFSSFHLCNSIFFTNFVLDKPNETKPNMKLSKIAFLPLAAALMMACHGAQQPQPEERVVEYVDSATGIVTLRDYRITDTITINGKLYSYDYSLQHVDSMGVVINPQGLEYRESRVHVAVRRGEETIFDKTYYKNDFKAYVPDNELEMYTMVGVTYNDTKRGTDNSALYFIVTVGDPDETSDMAYPLELKVAADGSHTFSKARNLDTEPLRPGMNIDPSDDAGV